LTVAKIAATTAMAPRAISAQPHQGTPPLPELDVAGVVWVAWTVTDFELMMVAGAARLVEVLVTVLVGPVTACVLVAVTVERVPASALVVTVALLAFAAAPEAEFTTFSAALDAAPLVDPAPHALSGTVKIAIASAPESSRIRVLRRRPASAGGVARTDEARRRASDSCWAGCSPASSRPAMGRAGSPGRCWHHLVCGQSAA
jgi:hypothetical protein